MATDKPRFSVTFTDDSYEKIRKYQKENNISTQSKAVAKLVELAINDIESENNKIDSPDTDESMPGEDEVLRIYEALNTMLVSAGIIKEDEDITERQADVLIAICRIIDATFED